MRTPRKTYSCATCGTKKEALPSQVGKQFFCSRSCYHQSLKLAVPHNKGKKTTLTKACKNCAVKFFGSPSVVKRKSFCNSKCAGDYFAKQAGSDLDRIQANIFKCSESKCWVWQAAKNGGYGRARFSDGQKYVHRKTYELLVGPISKDLQLDHLCRNRACCNPEHLEPVTLAENVRRGDAGKFSPTSETKEKMKKAMIARYEDPAFREAQRKHLDKIRNDGKRLDALRLALKDPDHRNRKSDQMKNIWKERHSAC